MQYVHAHIGVKTEEWRCPIPTLFTPQTTDGASENRTMEGIKVRETNGTSATRLDGLDASKAKEDVRREDDSTSKFRWGERALPSIL